MGRSSPGGSRNSDKVFCTRPHSAWYRRRPHIRLVLPDRRWGRSRRDWQSSAGYRSDLGHYRSIALLAFHSSGRGPRGSFQGPSGFIGRRERVSRWGRLRETFWSQFAFPHDFGGSCSISGSMRVVHKKDGLSPETALVFHNFWRQVSKKSVKTPVVGAREVVVGIRVLVTTASFISS